MDADSMTSEESPVMGVDVPRRYTDESVDGVLKDGISKRMSRETSLSVLSQDRITLSWTNLNAYVIPGSQKRCVSTCMDRSVEDMGYKHIIRNGSSQIALS